MLDGDSIADEDDTWQFWNSYAMMMLCVYIYVMERDGNSEKNCEWICGCKVFFGNMMLFRLWVFEVYPIILEMLLESGNGVFFPQGIMEMGIWKIYEGPHHSSDSANYGWQGLQQLCYCLQIRVYQAPSNSCVSSKRKRPRPNMNEFYHRLLQSSKYRRSSRTTRKSELRQIPTSHVIVITKICNYNIIRLNNFVGRSHNNIIFMWRPSAFENTGF